MFANTVDSGILSIRATDLVGILYYMPVMSFVSKTQSVDSE